MRPEDLDKAKKLIEETKILSQVEKAEWAQLLPQMNDKQVLELVKILTPKAPGVIPGMVPGKKPWELEVNPKELELPTSKPEFEPELPAPQAAQSQVQAKPRSPEDLQKIVEKIAPTKTPATPVPAPVNRPTATAQEILNSLRAKGIGVQGAPAKPAAVPQPPIPRAPLVKEEEPQPKPEPSKPLTLNAPEDFAKISPGDLHGKDPIAVLQEVLNALAKVAQKTRSFQAISNFQQSPLYRAYVNVGLALLNDPSQDRAVAFDNVISSLKSNGKDYLTKQEFEIFADFRKQIDKLFL